MTPQKTLESLMPKLTFGIELETIGCERSIMAAAIAEVVDGEWRPSSNVHGKFVITMTDGRRWEIVRDGSLEESHILSGEVVSPICTYADMAMVQNVARALARVGAKVNSACGIHIHVGVESMMEITGAGNEIPALIRLAKLVYQQEPLIFAALRVQYRRQLRYCKPVNESMIKDLARRRTTMVSENELARVWYRDPHADCETHALVRYHYTRYYGLNLHSVFSRGTVEFRYFEGALHAGKIKTYIQFVLALVAKSCAAKASFARKRDYDPNTAKYDFRVFLLRLGMIGPEFRTARLHLLANLKGTASTKRRKPKPTPQAIWQRAVVEPTGGIFIDGQLVATNVTADFVEVSARAVDVLREGFEQVGRGIGEVATIVANGFRVGGSS